MRGALYWACSWLTLRCAEDNPPLVATEAKANAKSRRTNPRNRRRSYAVALHVSQSIKEIVRNRTIWTTSILYLNDSSEFRHVVDVMSVHSTANQGRTRDAVDRGQENGRIPADTPNASQLNTQRAPGPFHFVAAFSSKGDDLAQWRAYCPRGGCSIGFSFANLKRWAKLQNTT